MRIQRKQWEWAILLSLGILTLWLAFVGFQIHFQREGIERNIQDILFQALKVFSAEFVDNFRSPLPWQLEAARWLGPLIFLYAAAKAVIFFLRRELRSFRARFYRRHLIVVGLHRNSKPLIQELLEKGEKVIVLTKQQDEREDSLEEEGAVFFAGSLDDEPILRRVNAHKSQHILLMGEEDEENLRQALFLRQTFETVPHAKPSIFVHTSHELRIEEWTSLGFFVPPEPNIPLAQVAEFKLLSLAQRGARILFNALGPDCFAPVREDAPAISIGLVGDSPLAQSFLLRIARLGHYANHQKPKVFWWLEDRATALELMQAFPGLDEILELQTFVHPRSLVNRETLEQAGQPLNVLYLLLEQETECLRILSKIQHPQAPHPLPVVISSFHADSITQAHSLTHLPGLEVFQLPLQEESLSREALLQEPLDALAKGIHQNYLNSLDKRNPDKITHREWPYLTIDARNQNREQADHLSIKLRYMGLDAAPPTASQPAAQLEIPPEQLEVLSKMEHNRWWASKLLGGWTFAPQESQEAMTHPDLVPYEELSEEIKDYDRRAVGNLPQLLKEMGVQLRPFNPNRHG